MATENIYDMTDSWTDGSTYTAVKMNVTDTSSNAASLLMDLQVGGTSKFKVSKGGVVTMQSGTAAAPTLAIGSATDGIYNGGSQITITLAGVDKFGFGNGWVRVGSASGGLAAGSIVGGEDNYILRAASNSWKFSAAAATTTSRTEINKAVASIADNTATATFTVTVPNAAHSAMLKVTLVGSLGAGGAVGANEATGTISYDFSIARTAGVDTVVTASTAYGSATSAVAGAATITVSAAASAMTGASSATQTFTINVTIARGSGSSANHTCLCYGRLLNANATGVTIA